MRGTKRFMGWAQDRLSRAEPTIGAIGPVLWCLAIACIVAAAWGVVVASAWLLAASLVVLAAVLGLATAPFWMVSVAVRHHYLRNAAVREAAKSMRTQLESAFVEHRILEDEFEKLDQELDDLRRGKTANDLAAAVVTYLRGVGWSLLWAGLLIGGTIFSVYSLFDLGNDSTSLTRTLTGVSLTVVVVSTGLATVFIAGASAAQRHARRTGQATEVRLQELRQMLLNMRRGDSGGTVTTTVG